jgi:single-stranded DNA-specific DHH superfamily exonuclease
MPVRKMSKINFNQARRFLNKISKKDKVAIIHHDDLDGYASGILLYLFCNERKAKVNHYGFSIGDPQGYIKKVIKKHNKIIFVDLGANTILDSLNEARKKSVLYIDHHRRDKRVPKEILEFNPSEKGYFPASRLCQELTQQKKWLGVAGLIGDSGNHYPENKKYLEDYFKNQLMSENEFKDQVVYPLIGALIYDLKNNIKIFNKILKINSLKDLEKMKKYSDKVQKEIDNLCNINSEAVKGFKDSSGGGHKKAAGGYFLKKDLQKFKENLKILSKKL